MTILDPSNYPASPGVYLMKDAEGLILYIGKAKNLRARLRNYFSPGGDGRAQIPLLMARVAAIEVILTDTEKEALLLENNLIKQHKPRYNIDLRDDKTYVSVRLDPHDEFPALEIVRQVHNDGALYFGPYASSGAIRQTLKEIYRLFPLRHSRIERCRMRDRPCLFHQIGQCSAPCHGKISAVDYAHLVQGVVALLSGRDPEVLQLLQQRMVVASAALRFEEAARLRDQIRAIQRSVERQSVADLGGGDQDILGLERDGGEVELVLLFIRQGKLLGKRSWLVEWRLDIDELIFDFLRQYYTSGVIIPDQILLPEPLEDADLLGGWLGELRGKKVQISTPQRGDKRRMVELACRNAADEKRQRGSRKEAREQVLKEILDLFHLPALPQRIECFDISNIQGTLSVGSMAVLIAGEAAPKEYRRYKIKTVEGADDYASLSEVLRRRLARGIDENCLPQMILIDGGKGQLTVLSEVLAELGLKNLIGIAGIAKSRVRANVRGKLVEKTEERFFLPGRKNPLRLRSGSPVLYMLERLRDETHRFAITYHRKLRSKATLRSGLEDIPGVGPARRKALLKHFGSLKQIRAARVEELLKVPGVSIALANEIFQTYQSPDNSPQEISE
ncbi:excinuclease ABC subunit UvrC [Geopsychrobacter electrodiphilus]|uniref:excinuclease ABC subunit UvrC n=1 Tax=Geopsychrobacter electrodiphilus TaxID=225196 RepID=UPI00068529AA|nr:excinuclease ABC subunit UvrC [Geopsychrobacter electrodiphilus]